MPSTDTEVAAVGRQHLKTAVLLGVRFIPLRLETATGLKSPVGEDAREAAGAGRSSPQGPRSREERQRLLDDLRQRHARDCRHCTSVTSHTNLVFGEGDPAARLMFIGEAPGEEEDRTGRPFVGRAGQKLDEIIRAMGMQREEVYIANILKSRPPENRTPLLPEVEACSPYLREQIRIIGPAVVVALGGPAAKMLLQTEIGITRLRGQWGVYADDGVQVPVMPTFHPAYLLRNYTPDTRKKMWSDMQAVLQRLQAGPAVH
jgi:uracil-DNA glycosylase